MTLTHLDILNLYKVYNGTIRSPGKFEGEPVYAPYFYDLLLQGEEDYTTEDNTEFAFIVGKEETEDFPDLLKVGDHIMLYIDDMGFVYCRLEEPRQCDVCGQMRTDVRSTFVSYVGDTSVCSKCTCETREK